MRKLYASGCIFCIKREGADKIIYDYKSTNNMYILVSFLFYLGLFGTHFRFNVTGTSDGLPRNVKNTNIKFSKLLESTRSQINGLSDNTASTLVNNLNNNTLFITVVGDFHAFVTVFKLLHSLR